jgi:4a-hydroxytetrahydrobiopterin dehydratase
MTAAMRTKLSDLEIRRALTGLPGWARKGDVLQKTYSFARFADGIRFVQQIAELADTMNHHPDIDIRYTTVGFFLSTHDAGGITQRDLDLAQSIEKAAGFDQKRGA